VSEKDLIKKRKAHEAQKKAEKEMIAAENAAKEA